MTERRLHMFLGWIGVMAGALLLAGCMQATRSGGVRHFDLGAVVAARHLSPTPSRGKVLRIARVAAAPWLDGTAMHYRLDYEDARAVAAYAQSDWAAPPSAMLMPILRATLSARGGWRAVIGPGDPAASAASLHIRLDDFSQAFSEPRDSAGVIDATATLIDDRDDRVLGQRHFHVEVAASSADAAGGVQALAEASHELAALLQQWLGTLDHQGFSRHGR